MTFGERLKQLRKEKMVTLEEVANVIGTGRAAVHKYEKGVVTNVPPDKLHALANFFGVSRPYLMGWTDERNANPDVNLDMVAERLSVPPKGNPVHNASYWRTPCSDCTTAATQACRALVKFGVKRTPIYPQQILQASGIATVISFANPAELSNIEKNPKLSWFRLEDGMVLHAVYGKKSAQHHLFATNRDAPIGKLRMALAVEIGHVYLGHVGFRPDAVRRQEAECFAIHLEFPRPLVKLLQERGFIFTTESFSRIFGDCEWCLKIILNANPVNVSPELNRLLKEQFAPYADMLEEMGILSMPYAGDELDLSRYMAGYQD